MRFVLHSGFNHNKFGIYTCFPHKCDVNFQQPVPPRRVIRYCLFVTSGFDEQNLNIISRRSIKFQKVTYLRF